MPARKRSPAGAVSDGRAAHVDDDAPSPCRSPSARLLDVTPTRARTASHESSRTATSTATRPGKRRAAGLVPSSPSLPSHRRGTQPGLVLKRARAAPSAPAATDSAEAVGEGAERRCRVAAHADDDAPSPCCSPSAMSLDVTPKHAHPAAAPESSSTATRPGARRAAHLVPSSPSSPSHRLGEQPGLVQRRTRAPPSMRAVVRRGARGCGALSIASRTDSGTLVGVSGPSEIGRPSSRARLFPPESVSSGVPEDVDEPTSVGLVTGGWPAVFS